MNILADILQIYVVILFARIILSYFPIGPGSALGPVVRALDAVTEPVLAPVRRAVPPVRMGSMGLDLSPIIVLVAISVIRGVLLR
ncbi:MAG TPA: YggT family protein [Acidimicrobiales bacterium]|nr:YggT family protein [Acidimicrobiales bacterium]